METTLNNTVETNDSMDMETDLETDMLNNTTDNTPNNRILIGINGEIGCGKSTAVNYLAGKGFSEYMFAKPLKDIAVILGFESHQVFGTQEQKLEINKFWNVSGREFLQKFGSEVCRDYVPKALPNMQFNNCTMWVRLFEKYYATSNGDIAVSDLRFEDESKKIKSLGGIVIRIVRPNNLPSTLHNNSLNSSFNALHLSHKSELQSDTIYPNIVINNNGTLEDLYNKLDCALNLINAGFTNVSNLVAYL